MQYILYITVTIYILFFIWTIYADRKKDSVKRYSPFYDVFNDKDNDEIG